MKSDRLLSILLLLQARGQMSATDLAERLEVSVRTIFRDVEALSAAGVPVYTERGRNGGIALVSGYRTDVTGLTEDESRALFVFVSDRAHAELGLGPAIASALRKVMAALPTAHRAPAVLASQRILVDPVRWRTGPQRPPDLDVLQNAVFADQRVQVHYRHGRDDQARSYLVDPYGLVNKAGAWYLVADFRREPRLFRVDRIITATVADEPVQRRAGVELGEVWDELRRQVDDVPATLEVAVRVRRQGLARFLRFHEGDLIEPPPRDLPEGDESWVNLRMNFRSVISTTQLLGLGPEVEVLAPTEVRDHLSRLLSDLSARYVRPDA